MFENIIGFILNSVSPKRETKKLSLDELIQYINEEYYFDNLNDNLVNDIYTVLIKSYDVKIHPVEKDDEIEYYALIIDGKKYKITDKGIIKKE